MGAKEATNNTRELTALIEGMIWLDTELPDGGNVPVTIKYDFKYAAGMTRGKEDFTDSRKTKSLRRRHVDWCWAKANSGKNENCMADKLADEGKNGEIGKHNKRWAAPRHQ